ncbi:MAG: iron ABC transporter permease [Bacteroidetes bacterium]|nr:iron ABC transporter permease [Bacteroidota bacterium]MBT3750774.1 iron ABC transporter permease [Bacteroidota bacterium]MBT4409616.1 iron ABC transporter permease [Bacteroidota bacterium]MBT5427604.1 iron ABC transporter permease [Bacteroidota bacterium]MBT7091905.1 iron ABC transporter permease [Bacteroidota bacterium]
MNQRRKIRLFFTLLIAGVLLLFCLDLLLGSVLISPAKLIRSVGPDGEEYLRDILLVFRLPKALTAILVGSGLSLAGLMMQTLFRNPLAGPFVLGISSGASLGVAIFVMAAGIGGLSIIGMPFVGSLGLVGASMLGSVLVMMLVIAVSVRVNDSVSILIIGIMFGSITGAIVSVLEYFSDPDTVHSFLVWTFGSISGVTWNQFVIFAPIVVTGILFTLFMQKPLNALLLGENYARGIGVDVKRSRLWIILLTSVIAGGLTAFTGPIAFIGVAVPHLARNLLKSSDHRILIPATICIGSILMLCCDIISQMPGSNQVLPINSVTALFGAPVVIWVITRRKRRSLAN